MSAQFTPAPWILSRDPHAEVRSMSTTTSRRLSAPGRLHMRDCKHGVSGGPTFAGVFWTAYIVAVTVVIVWATVQGFFEGIARVVS